MKRIGCALVALALLLPSIAHAQRRAPFRPPPPDDDDEVEAQPQQVEETAPEPLRGRFGSDRAEVLMRGGDSEQVRQGIVRAAVAGTPEAVALIVAQAEATNNDDKTLVDLARALGPFAAQEAARQQLIQLLNATSHASHNGRPSVVSGARVELARQIAARALVASRDPQALDAVYSAARESGTGQQNALRALASDPGAAAAGPLALPNGAAGAHALAQSGDLRALDLLLTKAQGNIDASTRAACMVAAAQLGDGRVRPLAIAAFADPDAHVRSAAGEALVLLDAPERFRAVVQLLGADDTAAAAVRLAHRAQDLEVVKALASRLKVISDVGGRQDVIAALGRGVATDEGLKVLASYAADPVLGGDAVHAIARSPNPAATRILETLASTPALRRLAVRGYVLRVLVRRERSSALDGVLDALRGSRDPADRALAAFARVALGQASARDHLEDADASIRRAAAMGALAGFDGQNLPAAGDLLARYIRETDDATRAVLAIGLLDGDAKEVVPTRTLSLRVEAGGADALLSATALGARKSDALKDTLDGLLASADPVMRAHVARGLGASEEPSATGRLAEAARYEADAAGTPRGGDRPRAARVRARAHRDAAGHRALRSRSPHARHRRARPRRRDVARALASARGGVAPRGARRRHDRTRPRRVRHVRRRRHPHRVRRRRLRPGRRNPAGRRPPHPRARATQKVDEPGAAALVAVRAVDGAPVAHRREARAGRPAARAVASALRGGRSPVAHGARAARLGPAAHRAAAHGGFAGQAAHDPIRREPHVVAGPRDARRLRG